MPESAVVPALFPALTATLDGSARADVLPVWSDREAARAAGFAAGFAAGARAAGRAAETARRRAALEREEAAHQAKLRLEAGLTVLAAAAQAAQSRSAPVLADVQATLHRNALELARALLAVELRNDETSSAAALARVRAAAEVAPAVTVRLNPQDLALLAEVPSLPPGVVLVPDPSLARGEALAEHADGWLDGRIDEALRRAQAALEGAA